VQADGILAGGGIPGTETSVVSAPGLTLGVDTRDNTWYPSRGVKLAFRAHWARDGFGSDYAYEMYELDLRGYRALGDRMVLAGQFMGTSLDGAPPFYMLPRLGGEQGLRGYRGSLYRDRTAALGRVELRRAEIWNRFGAVVFGGIGDVAPRVSKLTLAKRLWTAGFGLRFAWDETEKVNVRLDFGWGNGDSGFFLSLGEAF
jgi:outer membrane translocation and assembly module TamA